MVVLLYFFQEFLPIIMTCYKPMLLAIGGVGEGAKRLADGSVKKGKEALLDAVSTGVIPAPKVQQDLNPLAIGGAAGGSSLIDGF